MTDYTKLIEALRCKVGLTEEETKCEKCPYGTGYSDWDVERYCADAAAAIEELQETLEAVQKNSGINFRMWEEAQAEVERLQAQLPKQRNLVEVVRCKDCYWNQTQRFENGKEYCECSRGNSRINDGDWYCPEGEKMEVQE